MAFVLLLSALPVVLSAQRSVPYLSGRVVDEAGLFGDQARQIEERLKALEARGAAQMAVLTVDSLEGEPIEDFSIRVAETWQLGDREADHGVLFVVARTDRKMRLEVGYGLEDRITDVHARRIVDRIVSPAFRGGDFAAGTLRAIDAVDSLLEGQTVASLEKSDESNGSGCVSAVPTILWILFVFWIISRRRGGGLIIWSSSGGWGRGGWSGGSSGGFSGGFSGGGGSFGGGGASGSW